MPFYPHMDRYYAEKRRLIDFGGSEQRAEHPQRLHLSVSECCQMLF